MIFKGKIISKNSDGIRYVIDLKTGEKYTVDVCGTLILTCPDTVSENDAFRAKQEDEIDISSLIDKDFEVNKERKEEVKRFILSNRHAFGAEKVKEIL